MGTKAQRQLKRLRDQREQLIAAMEALRNQIAGLDMAIELVGKGSPERDGGTPRRVRKTSRRARANVTATLLELLRDSGSEGLNAEGAVAEADRRGFALKRGSVSSLLSQLKRDGTVVYENSRYKLKEFHRRSVRPVRGHASIVTEEPLRPH